MPWDDATLDAFLHPLMSVLEARNGAHPVPDNPTTFSDTPDEAIGLNSFSAEDLAHFHDYYGPDDKGHYNGNLHKAFKVGYKQFADKLGLRRVGVTMSDGKPGFVWAQREKAKEFAEDASGHEHKGKGEGGGQFVKKGDKGNEGNTEKVNGAERRDKATNAKENLSNEFPNIVDRTEAGHTKAFQAVMDGDITKHAEAIAQDRKDQTDHIAGVRKDFVDAGATDEELASFDKAAAKHLKQFDKTAAELNKAAEKLVNAQKKLESIKDEEETPAPPGPSGPNPELNKLADEAWEKREEASKERDTKPNEFYNANVVWQVAHENAKNHTTGAWADEDYPDEPDEWEEEELPDEPDAPEYDDFNTVDYHTSWTRDSGPKRSEFDDGPDGDEGFADEMKDWKEANSKYDAAVKEHKEEHKQWKQDVKDVQAKNKTAEKDYNAAKKDWEKQCKTIDKKNEDGYTAMVDAYDKWEKHNGKLEERNEKLQEKRDAIQEFIDDKGQGDYDDAEADYLEAIEPGDDLIDAADEVETAIHDRHPEDDDEPDKPKTHSATFSDADSGETYPRSFSDAEVETMAAACGTDAATFADRNHLVKKKVNVNRGGKITQEWRLVNPDKGKHAGKEDTPKKRGADHNPTLDAETAVSHAINAPHELSPDHVERLADHLDMLPRDRLREIAHGIGAKIGPLKMHLVERILDHVKVQVDPKTAKGSALERRLSGNLEAKDLKPGELFSRPRRVAIEKAKEEAAKPKEEPKPEPTPEKSPEIPLTPVDKVTPVNDTTPVEPSAPGGDAAGGGKMELKDEYREGEPLPTPPEGTQWVKHTVEAESGDGPGGSREFKNVYRLAPTAEAVEKRKREGLAKVQSAQEKQAALADIAGPPLASRPKETYGKNFAQVPGLPAGWEVHTGTHMHGDKPEPIGGVYHVRYSDPKSNGDPQYHSLSEDQFKAMTTPTESRGAKSMGITAEAASAAPGKPSGDEPKGKTMETTPDHIEKKFDVHPADAKKLSKVIPEYQALGDVELDQNQAWYLVDTTGSPEKTRAVAEAYGLRLPAKLPETRPGKVVPESEYIDPLERPIDYDARAKRAARDEAAARKAGQVDEDWRR